MKRNLRSVARWAAAGTLGWLLLNCKNVESNGTTVTAASDVPVAQSSLTQTTVTPTAAPRDPDDIARICRRICDASVSLRCRRADACNVNCTHMAAAEMCHRELMRFYDCLAKHPAQHWECLEDGSGAIKEGFCDKEQASFADCLQGSGPR